MVSFDDIDTNDVVDISTALTTAAVWNGGMIDPALKTLLEGGFTASVDRRGGSWQHAVELHGQRRQP